MSRSTRDPAERAVAVIGVGAILPDALDAKAFWQNVVTGRNSVSEVTPDRWNSADYYDPDPKAPGKTYSKIGGWVRGVSFEPTKYRIPPTVAAAMDDGQKWALLCAGEALRDAGHPDRPLDTESTGVILGNAMGGELHYLTCLRLFMPEYVHAIADTQVFQSLPQAERAALLAQLRESVGRRFPDTTEDSMPGELTNITSGRVAAVFNLRGPNFTADAACASSLAALQAAVDGLADHHYDVVVTGAMDRNMGPTTFIKFCKIGALSPDGSRPYDKDANGFIMGEGGAFLVCKRLEDAEKAGDRIYAVVRGVGGSSDGKGKGITAPNPVGQILALRRAWERAGLDPATVTLLEGHGTSTRAGDVAEMETVSKLLSEGSPIKHRIALGSIKSQIGHLKSAAGAASLLKVVLACHHKILPPSINFNQPNPSIPWDKLPVFVNTKPQPWEKPSFGPRRAGLSAFGFGGTNFHVVVEEYVPGMLTRRAPVVQVPTSFSGGSPGATLAQDTRPSMLGNMLAVGGADAGAVRAALTQALARAKAGQTSDRRPPGPDFLAAPARLVIGFEDAADLAKKGELALAAFEKNEPKKWRLLQSKSIHFRQGPAGKLAFLFPGQGSQYVNMLADVPDPIVRETFAEADRVMGPILGQPLTEYVYKNEADPTAMQAAEEALKDTTICQPAMVASDIAIMRLLDKHGVKPDIVMGHSLGEWAAAVGAGMVTFPEALVAVSARARAMASVSIGDKGKMASVAGPADEIGRRLPEIGGYLTLANINSRKQTVIAGASDAVDRAVDYFNKLGMTAQLIPVSHAFHSKVVAPASDALYRTICEMEIAFPRIPLVGNIDGELYPTHDMDTIKRRLADQMASSVQFVKGVETCYREGARIFVEVGPKRALMALAESILEDKDDVICFSTNHPKRGGVRSFHEAMCGFYAAGIPRPENLLAAVAATQPDPVARAAATPVQASIPTSSHGAPQTMSESPIRTSAGQPDYDGLGRLFARFLDEGMALYGGRRSGPPALPESRAGSIVVSGAALGLPGQKQHVFDDSNVDRILRGDSFIDPVPHVFRARMVEKNVVRLVKREVGEPSLDPIKSVDEVIRLAGRRGAFDIVEEFGIPRERVEAWDITTALAIAAGIEALRDAGIPLVRHYRRTTTGSFLPDRWRLPVAMADETGVIFASAFPGYDNLVDEVTRFFSQRTGRSSYEFDRRFLFRILAMGHAQFAELLGIRGPNTQVNAACASTTMAVGMAEDWIRVGRCRRVLIIGADDVTSDNLLEWMGAGFLATGAATTEDVLEKAALPFDRRRNGMLLGMGACGLVVESEDSLRERGMRGLCEVLGSEFANSAFHGTRLDVDHIEGVMERLVSGVEKRHGIDRHAMARELVFISHETYTPARGGSASAEVFALRKTFGGSANDLVVCNTKGFTGHPMGVGVEDAVAVKILEKQVVPPVPNYREPDPELGTLNLSKGGHYPVRYALRLAAGFGSQIAMTVLRRIDGLEERVADRAVYQRWLSDISGYPAPALEVEKRTLRIKDNGPPAREPAQSSWTMGTGPRASLGDEGPMPVPTAPRAPIAPAVAAIATPAAQPAPVPTATATVVPSAAVTTAVAASGGDVAMESVLKLVSDKTGYPRDMLDPDLDLEADLGIDTVKQAEVFALVRETFNIPRQDTLKLRDYPTLRHVVGFVKENRPDLAGAAGSVPAPAPASVPVPAPAPGSSVAEKVLGMVAEKTGYPRDMLELDLDLEADLGIDTVKQAEVFALVREAFSIPRQDDVKLRDYPTLRHVIGFVNKYLPAAAPVAPAAPPGSAPTAPAATVAAPALVVAEGPSPFVSGLLRRPVVTLRPPLDSCKKTGVRLEKGSRVVVVADSEGAGKLLCEQLESRGVQVLRIDARPERAEIEAALHTWAQAGNVAGLYFLPALDRSAPLSDIDLVQFRKLYRDRVLLLHGAARGLYETLNPGCFVISATRMGGQHGYGAAGAINSVGGAVTGFTKTLRRERPDLLAKAVDFEDGASAELVARALLDETERDPGAVEIGYAGGLRVTVGLEVMQAVPTDAKSPVKLDQNTVFAVTGGAGAITVAIVRDLAAASRGTFYLLDARAMPPASEHALLETVVKDREAAKREVFEHIKAEKGRATPAQVEEKLFDLERQAGILEALRGVEQAGGRAFYRQVDVLDGAAIKAVVDNIRAESGRIDVILHAAGLERSRSLDRKPVEEFDLVFRVKADGLFNLMAATREMDVKAIVGFSSVAGRFGNAGQADYSSGNDFMCKTLSWWAASRPGSLGIALDWTAWGGIGMATRGSIPEIMKRAGIDMLSPAEGLPVIRHALQAGFSGEAVVGHKLGILMEPFDKDGGIDPNGSLLARAREKALPLPFDNVSFDLHQGMTAEIRLDPKVEPFLYDHAIDGIPVLPGVMGLETFAEAAWLLTPSLRVAALENVRFLAAMKYYRHEPRSVIVRARPLLGADGRVRVHMTLSSIQVVVGREPEEKLHFVGVVVLEQGQGQSARTAVDGAGPVGGIGHDDIYRVYFHGPAYRVLEMVNRLSSGQVVGTMRTPLPADTTNPNSTSMVGPRMVELCFQTAGVWEIGQTGQMGLPSVVERVTVFDPAPNGKPVVAELQPHPSQDALSFDMRVRDDDGKVYLTVEGYRTARIPGGLPDEALGAFRGVVG